MAFDPQTLINSETGEFDWTVIKRQAVVRAQRIFGDCAPPVSAVRSEILNLKAMAAAFRSEWRKARGLPNDTEMFTVTSYAKDRSGVRRSAF